jgi:hypothetical protein
LLAIEKCEERKRVSFEHVQKAKTEIGFTYFGNVLIGEMVRVTGNTTAQQQKPMRLTVASELKECIGLDETYEKEDKVKGYELN